MAEILGFWTDHQGDSWAIITQDGMIRTTVKIIPGAPMTLKIVDRSLTLPTSQTSLSSQSDNEKKHYCYLLRSLNPKFSRRTYIGYTVDPARRLRQHNGEICGGAKKTKFARPWRMVCYIEGFPDERTALQFEWINHHPKSIRRNNKGKPTGSVRNGVNGKITTLAESLVMERWTSTALDSSTMFFTIHWLESGYQMNFPTASYPSNCREVFDY
jgi:predicted GIY-YIG superfamily endonuclease